MDDDNIDDDPIERELDVYLSQTLSNQLHLLQFPLIPCTRSLDLPTTVDFRPDHELLEMKVPIIEDETFDKDAPKEQAIKEILYESTRITPHSQQAIGILREDSIHITPLKALLQMRPSRKHLDSSLIQESLAKKEESKEEEMKEMKVQYTRIESIKEKQQRITFSQIKKAEEDEDKISLTVHGQDSDFLEEQSQLLLYRNYEEISEPVPLQSSLITYINELKDNAKPPIYNINTINNNNNNLKNDNNNNNNNKSYNKHLNLIEFHYKNERDQIYLLLYYGHILSTNEIIDRINPINTNDENIMSTFYSILMENGYLIRNRWISKSELHYEGYMCLIRDIILYLLYKDECVNHDAILNKFYIDANELNKMVSEFAVYNTSKKGYMLKKDMYEEYRENKESIIIPESVIEQEKNIMELLYLNRSKELQEYHNKLHNRELLVKHNNNQNNNNNNNNNNNIGYNINSNTFTFSPLDPLVKSIIKEHDGIVRESDLRQYVSEGKNDPKYASYFVDKFPEDYYKISLSNVAIFIPQSTAYILKSIGNEEIDKYRDIIIKLLLPGQSVQKKVIKEKIKSELKLNLPEHTYSKIMKELLPVVQSGIGWTFKTYL